MSIAPFVVGTGAAQEVHWAPRPNPKLEEHTRAEFRLTAKPIWIRILQTQYAALVGRLINLKTAISTVEAAPALVSNATDFLDERAESLKPEMAELAKRLDDFKQARFDFDQQKICSDRSTFDRYSLAASSCMFFAGKCIRVLTDDELFAESQNICLQQHAVLLGVVPSLSSAEVSFDQIMAHLSWRIERLRSKTIFESIATSNLQPTKFTKAVSVTSLRASLSSVKDSKTCDQARGAYADLVAQLSSWGPVTLKHTSSTQRARIESVLQRVFVSNSDIGLSQCGYLQPF